MVTRTSAPARRKAGKPTSAASDQPDSALPVAPAGPSMLVSLARQLQTWSGSILGGVGTATDMAMTLAQSRVHRPGPKAAVAKAAALYKKLHAQYRRLYPALKDEFAAMAELP